MRPLLLALAIAGCRRAPAPAPRCEITGDWRADLTLYDGTAHITTRDRDALELELVGKGTQRGPGRWLDARHVDFELPSGDVRCEIASDCRRIACGQLALGR